MKPVDMLETGSAFRLDAEGRLFHNGPWKPCIQVDGKFLDAVTRHAAGDDAISVRGHVEVLAGEISMTIWDSITFRCANGTATYDFSVQDGYDRANDYWSGTLRSSVEPRPVDRAFR